MEIIEQWKIQMALGKIGYTEKSMQSVLMHFRFDQHAELPRPTYFKNNDECRANLSMMVCNKSYLFDNEHILSNSDDFYVVHAS